MVICWWKFILRTKTYEASLSSLASSDPCSPAARAVPCISRRNSQQPLSVHARKRERESAVVPISIVLSRSLPTWICTLVAYQHHSSSCIYAFRLRGGIFAARHTASSHTRLSSLVVAQLRWITPDFPFRSSAKFSAILYALFQTSPDILRHFFEFNAQRDFFHFFLLSAALLGLGFFLIFFSTLLQCQSPFFPLMWMSFILNIHSVLVWKCRHMMKKYGTDGSTKLLSDISQWMISFKNICTTEIMGSNFFLPKYYV